MDSDEDSAGWRTAPKLWEQLKPRARLFRAEPTQAESLLWAALRAGRLNGMKFRRQHAIGPFLVDFYCSAARLVIEIDGPIHDSQAEEDAARQRFLESQELRVLRFTNDEVIQNLDSVLKRIVQTVFDNEAT